MSHDTPGAAGGETGSLALRAGDVVLPHGRGPATLLLHDGRIADVLDRDEEIPAGARVETLDEGLVVLPGLVDTHVHCNDPGRADWEGFPSATAAALAGGITTIVDMPLNSLPPTTSPEALAEKRRAATGRVHCDVGFWGGAVPENLADLPRLLDAGALGVKCFLAPSGVPEFGHLDEAALSRALVSLAPRGGLLLVHAEDPDVLAREHAHAGGDYAVFEASRPAAAEEVAVGTVIAALRRAPGARAHVVHVSAPSAAAAIAAAARDGLAISGETCPHYLALSVDGVPPGATQFKCCPPIRTAQARDDLWRALAAGALRLVVSDHSPSPADLKHLDTGDMDEAWGGIASVQLSLPVVWTAARERGHGLQDLARWMAQAPAALAGLTGKGRIEPGADADLCVLDPDGRFEVDPAALLHRHPLTPYAGRTLTGVVRATYLAGRRVAHDGTVSTEPTGRLLEATRA